MPPQLGIKEVGKLPQGLPAPSWIKALNWYGPVQSRLHLSPLMKVGLGIILLEHCFRLPLFLSLDLWRPYLLASSLLVPFHSGCSLDRHEIDSSLPKQLNGSTNLMPPKSFWRLAHAISAVPFSALVPLPRSLATRLAC